MKPISKIKESIQKWWKYISENRNILLHIVEKIDVDSLFKEDQKIMSHFYEILKNFDVLQDQKIYRWIWPINIDWYNKYPINNYITSLSEATIYWNIVLEYDYNFKNAIEKDIKEREIDVIKYDQKIQDQKIAWYYWYLWVWMYHYRLKDDHISLNKIHYYPSEENLHTFILFTRKLLSLSQNELWLQLWVSWSTISKYENLYIDPNEDIVKKCLDLIKNKYPITIHEWM